MLSVEISIFNCSGSNFSVPVHKLLWSCSWGVCGCKYFVCILRAGVTEGEMEKGEREAEREGGKEKRNYFSSEI